MVVLHPDAAKADERYFQCPSSYYAGTALLPSALEVLSLETGR